MTCCVRWLSRVPMRGSATTPSQIWTTGVEMARISSACLRTRSSASLRASSALDLVGDVPADAEKTGHRPVLILQRDLHDLGGALLALLRVPLDDSHGRCAGHHLQVVGPVFFRQLGRGTGRSRFSPRSDRALARTPGRSSCCTAGTSSLCSSRRPFVGRLSRSSRACSSAPRGPASAPVRFPAAASSSKSSDMTDPP